MKFLYPIAVVATVLPQSVFACCDDDKSVLQPLVVTATREEQAIERTLAPILVINREEIELSLARDLADLLRFHAGLEIARNGGTGKTTSLFVRGTDSNHVMVMIDGVKINPGTIGGAAIQNIRPDMIQRIEVIKGPRSSLYGSDAIGGVINIITRSTDRNYELSTGGGHFGTRAGSAMMAWRGAGKSLQATFSRFATDGFPIMAGGTIDRGYDNNTARIQAGTRVGAADLGFAFWQASGTSEYMDFLGTPVSQDYRNRTTSVTLGMTPGQNWSSRLVVARISDVIRQNDSADYVQTDRSTLDWYNSLAVSDTQRLSAGLYLSRENAETLSFGSGFDRDRDDQAVYVQDQLSLGDHQLLLAARFSNFDSFGNITTWNAEYGFLAGGRLMLTASAGTGFRAPDATDLFGFGGNPDLFAEESENFELGIRWLISQNSSVTLHAFDNRIDNLIQFVIFDPMTFAGQNQNVSKARIKGIEATWRLRNNDWDLHSSVIVQDPRNISDDQQLLRRSKRSVTAGITRHQGAFDLGINVLTTDARKDFGFPSAIDLGGYTLVNLHSRYRFSEQWQVRLKVENLLNKDYQTAFGFNSSERAAFVTVDYLVPAK